MLTHPDPDQGLDRVYTTIESYYTAKVLKHGAHPRGVDWTCVATQELRFVQLLKICTFSMPFSLNDVGCGYGALLAYLARRHPDAAVDYFGIDLSPAMIRLAERRWRNRAMAKFATDAACDRVADYSVASGIFNVKLNQPTDLWQRFVTKTLGNMRARSRRGFAVNFMAPQDPAQPSIAELYRTEPEPWIRYCKREFRSSVEVVRDYGLREFTLLIRC